MPALPPSSPPPSSVPPNSMPPNSMPPNSLLSNSLPLKAEKFVRRQPALRRAESSLSRRRSGALAMACVALATLAQRRLTYDSILFMSFEAVVCTASIVVAGWLFRLRPAAIKEPSQLRPNLSVLMLLAVSLVWPWIINGFGKRAGAGNGDTLIAAKNHATSFGAVETEMFLESEKLSLFDVFSDEFGEPKRKDRVERAQALSQQDAQSEEGRYSEANRSSSEGEFGIERKQSQRKPPVEDLASHALFYWHGEANAHLAVQRFRYFDGVSWKERRTDLAATDESAEQLVAPFEQPESLDVDGQTWFFAPRDKFSSSLSPYVGALAEAAKFTRYGSPIIPSRCGTKLWCIDRISRGDFFHYDAADCLSMPGRKHVPDYTVVRFVNGRLDLERMEQLLQHCSPGQGHVQGSEQCRGDVAAMAHSYTVGTTRGWQQVNSVISRLRTEFKHQPDLAGEADEVGALQRFLKERSGPSYLFATAAALMLEHLGYETRLVTGFYVNKKHYIVSDDEYAIQPSDVHVWLEVNAGHGYAQGLVV